MPRTEVCSLKWRPKRSQMEAKEVVFRYISRPCSYQPNSQYLFPFSLKNYMLESDRKIFLIMSHNESQRARKFKKVQAKKLVKSNKSKNVFREITFLAVLNFFPVQKLNFDYFWSSKKWKLIYLISRVFWPTVKVSLYFELFFRILANCVE